MFEGAWYRGLLWLWKGDVEDEEDRRKGKVRRAGGGVYTAKEKGSNRRRKVWYAMLRYVKTALFETDNTHTKPCRII